LKDFLYTPSALTVSSSLPVKNVKPA